MKKLAFLVVFLLFSVLSSATVIQRKVEDGGNGHWYEPVSVPGGINWITAKDTAVLMGGYLVTSTSHAENNFVFNLVSDEIYWDWGGYGEGTWGPWLGGYQLPGSLEPKGGWGWVSGESFIYSNWIPGQPDNNTTARPNYSEEAIHYNRLSQWNDLSDHLMYTNGFIVEYNEIPEPATISLLVIGALSLFRRKTH